MTETQFRTLALALAGAVESEHVNHPDFRVRGKVFASLGYPEKGWGMVKLTPDQQRLFVRRAAGAFIPAAGAWGRAGSTTVALAKAGTPVVRAALKAAHANIGAARKHGSRP